LAPLDAAPSSAAASVRPRKLSGPAAGARSPTATPSGAAPGAKIRFDPTRPAEAPSVERVAPAPARRAVSLQAEDF
jgi:hypothetical protein